MVLKRVIQLGFAALLSLGFAAWAGIAPAHAADNSSGDTLYSSQDFCHGASSPVAADAQGFVNFHLDGNTVTLNYHVKGGPADATIYVYGYSGFCNFDAFLGTVTTNSNGVGNADFTYAKQAADTEVWTFAYSSPFGLAQDVESSAVTP
jgi:hypothetical protein